MNSILALDTLAQRYSLLPSQILNEATTFDLYICNSVLRYQQIKEAEREGDFSHYSEEALLNIKSQIN